MNGAREDAQHAMMPVTDKYLRLFGHLRPNSASSLPLW